MLHRFWRGHGRARVVVSVVVSLLAGLPAAALAQDSERPFTWTGFYAGLNLGGEFLTGAASMSCSTPNGTPSGFGCPFPTSLRTDAAGVAGGAQGGYLYQIEHTVLGIEADLSALSAQATGVRQAPLAIVGGLPSVAATETVKQQVDWLATVRARVGYDFGHALAYITGGFALGHTRLDGQVTFPNNPFSYRMNGQATMPGYAVGGGLEYAMLDRWTVRAEAFYFDLGTQSVWSTGGSPPVVNGFTTAYSARFDGVIARLAVNYRF